MVWTAEEWKRGLLPHSLCGAAPGNDSPDPLGPLGFLLYDDDDDVAVVCTGVCLSLASCTHPKSLLVSLYFLFMRLI